MEKNNRLLSVVGKLYLRVLVKRVRAGTECAIREEQCGFRQGTGCMDQVVVVVIAVVVVVGQTVGSISSKTLAYDCLCTLEFCTASMIATS